MSYTLQEFRDLIRVQLDTDSDDIPDMLVDSWVREGWRFAVNRNRRWPFYRSQWTVTTVSGVSEYDDSLLVGASSAPQELDAVMTDDGRPIRWLGFDDAQRQASEQSGAPLYWNFVAGVLRVYPEPDNAYALTAYGWRQPVEWVDTANGGAVSDLPAAFDDVLLEWALGRAFQRQEEGDLGVMHLDQADVLLRQLQRRYMPHTASSPLILNDGVQSVRERPVVWTP